MSIAKEYFNELLEYFSDNRYLCIKEILAENAAASQKIGLKIYDNHPQYLLLSLYMDMPRSKPLLLHFLKKMAAIDPMFLYILINSGHLKYSDLQKFIPPGSEAGFINAAIERDWLLKGDDLGAPFLNTHKPEVLVELLDRIDDFRLYQYALSHDIEIPACNTVNYKWYLVYKSKDKDSAVELIKKTANFQDIKKLCELAGLRKVYTENYDLLIEYLLCGYSEDLLGQAWALFKSSKSFLNLKILLALLIASRKENNLVLALYLSYDAKFEENYEIDLIHLFLNRYFCFNKNILKLLKKLSVKNIQIYNNAYIWTDPIILTGDCDQFLAQISQFKLTYQKDLNVIESKVSGFLESQLVGHAVSLVKLYRELKSAVCMEEITQRRILATNDKTTYSGLLGEQCDYLFNKLTADHKRSEKGCLESLYSVTDSSSYNSVLENPFTAITCPKFLYEFDDLVNLNRTKSASHATS